MSGRSTIRLSWEPRQLGAFEMSRIGSVRATSLAEYRYRGNCPPFPGWGLFLIQSPAAEPRVSKDSIFVGRGISTVD